MEKLNELWFWVILISVTTLVYGVVVIIAAQIAAAVTLCVSSMAGTLAGVLGGAGGVFLVIIYIVEPLRAYLRRKMTEAAGRRVLAEACRTAVPDCADTIRDIRQRAFGKTQGEICEETLKQYCKSAAKSKYMPMGFNGREHPLPPPLEDYMGVIVPTLPPRRRPKAPFEDMRESNTKRQQEAL